MKKMVGMITLFPLILWIIRNNISGTIHHGQTRDEEEVDKQVEIFFETIRAGKEGIVSRMQKCN
jgi:hypothetical protein